MTTLLSGCTIVFLGNSSKDNQYSIGMGFMLTKEAERAGMEFCVISSH
jgi:hypothetical protein